MADILRATRGVPGFHDAARVHLVEASPSLRAAQAERIPTATWHDHAQTLPEAPLFLVANEFFDALPIRQFLREAGHWRERLIATDGAELTWGLGPASPQPALTERLDDTRDGDLVELCAPAAPIMGTLAARIAAHGGAALIVDYGDWRSRGDTFQALKAHTPVDPLAVPGSADLTAHVDFEALTAPARAAGCRVSQMTPQGVFLERLGITARAQTLATQLRDAALDSHIAAHRRLTHPDEMGSLFKVIGVGPMQAPLPAGLEP